MGGGAKSKVWWQIMVDIFNTQVVTLKVSEGAVYGAVLQALWCWRLECGEKIFINEITDEFVTVNKVEIVEPNAKNVEVYWEVQTIQDEMFLALCEVFARYRCFVLR